MSAEDWLPLNAANGDSDSRLSGEPLATTAFFQAVLLGDLNLMSRFLDEGKVDVNVEIKNGRSALHYAAARGNTPMLESLLVHGAEINKLDQNGRTPLDEAVLNKHPSAQKSLIKAGATFNCKELSESALLNAVLNGEVNDVATLLKIQVSPNACFLDGRTALHLAVARNSPDILELLIQAGADVNAKDTFGFTPLAEALRIDSHMLRESITQMLLQGGAQLGPRGNSDMRVFCKVFAAIEAVIIVLICACTKYAEETYHGEESAMTMRSLYPAYQDVHVMIFVGFGFLMTFLRKYGFSAVTLNLTIAALSLQLYILFEGLWGGLFDGHWSRLEIGLETLLLGDFAAAALLISFGAMLGKTSPTQALLVAVLEMAIFTLNERLALKWEVSDVGGSMVVHVFGAYFGLAASYMMTPKACLSSSPHSVNNQSCYHSDLFAMIGTLFLWMFWPSFNGALAADSAQQRTVVNTVVCIGGSCLSAVICSGMLSEVRKLSMVDIQNATLAGGVAVGTAANMAIQPGGALLIGAVAGLLSVVGYTRLTPLIESKLGVHDTCGVNNLHGMPGVLAGFIGAVVIALGTNDAYDGESNLYDVFGGRFKENNDGTLEMKRSAMEHALTNLGFLACTLTVSLLGGALAGAVVRQVEPLVGEFFEDSGNFEVPEEEVPYFFDTRGEPRQQHVGEPTSKGDDTRGSNWSSESGGVVQQSRSKPYQVENMASQSSLSKEELTKQRPSFAHRRHSAQDSESRYSEHSIVQHSAGSIAAEIDKITANGSEARLTAGSS